jgi:AAA15 family ATPase/GTPase
VDEIENGFYYRNLPTVLGTIWNICQSNNTQLIASTHSYELLQSVAEAMENESNVDLEKNTALVRLERRELGIQPDMRLIEGHGYKAAIASSFEVR